MSAWSYVTTGIVERTKKGAGIPYIGLPIYSSIVVSKTAAAWTNLAKETHPLQREDDLYRGRSASVDREKETRKETHIAGGDGLPFDMIYQNANNRQYLSLSFSPTKSEIRQAGRPAALGTAKYVPEIGGCAWPSGLHRKSMTICVSRLRGEPYAWHCQLLHSHRGVRQARWD